MADARNLQSASYAPFAVTARLAGVLVAVQRWLNVTRLSDAGIDELIEHLWRWPSMTPDKFVAWCGWSSPTLEAGLGGDLPDDLSSLARSKDVEPSELHELLMAMVEIVYGGLHGAVSDVETLNDLARVEGITSQRGVSLPPPNTFGDVPFQVRHRSGRHVTDAEVERWRRINYL